MALQSSDGGGVWIPSSLFQSHAISAAAFLIDATSEIAALVWRAPRDGNLDRFDFHIGTVANSPDNGLRASFQGVSLTTGLPDGTILGATNNGFVTYAHTVTTGWKSTNFGEVVAVTRGQLLACVVDIPSFTASDSVQLSRFPTGIGAITFPYGVSAVSTKQTTDLPVMAPHYTDGYARLGGVNSFGAMTKVTLTYNSGTGTADEWGLAFSVPFPCTLNQIAVQLSVAAGADFEVLVYDGTTVISTLSCDGDVVSTTSLGLSHFVLGTAVTIAANTTYRVMIRPTTANNVGLEYYTFQTADTMDAMEGGNAFYMTSRLDQTGAWTDYNSGTFRRPSIMLNLTAFDDAVSAGTGPRARYQMGMA